MLTRNKILLNTLAGLLLEKESLDEKEFKDIIQSTQDTGSTPEKEEHRINA